MRYHTINVEKEIEERIKKLTNTQAKICLLAIADGRYFIEALEIAETC